MVTRKKKPEEHASSLTLKLEELCCECANNMSDDGYSAGDCAAAISSSLGILLANMTARASMAYTHDKTPPDNELRTLLKQRMLDVLPLYQRAISKAMKASLHFLMPPGGKRG